MKNMRIVVTRYGGPETLELIEEDIPEPAPGEVRVKVLAAGVCSPDILARQGVHPETPKTPFTPGWDLVGTVELTGEGVTGIEPGQTVAAMPIHGAYTKYICLPKEKLVSVPAGLDPAESVSLILNYITAYQMMHRTAKVEQGRRILVHGAAGGVGTALLQLGKLANLEMYGTCSKGGMQAVSELGCFPIDYKEKDFVDEVLRLTDDGVDAVFDPVGGKHMWQSRKVLRQGGKVVGYGLLTSIRGEGPNSEARGRRRRYGGTARFGLYMAAGWILPGRRRVVPYSIQTLERLKPEWFREDLVKLFDLLKEGKLKPIVAERFPLAEARKAQERLAKGGVVGKIVLIADE